MLSTFNKLPVVIKIFFLSILEWLFYTGFTVVSNWHLHLLSHDKSKCCLLNPLYCHFFLKMLSAYYVCCIYSNTKASTMKPDQTAPKICLLKILLLPAENEAENGAY